jgi:hypothetical protein
MRVESATVTAFTIYDDDGTSGLDPVLVIIQDFGRGAGRIVLECYGQAWSSYWGAMGDRTIRQFFMSVGVDYLVNSLWPPANRTVRKAYREDYLRRIVESVRKAFAIPCLHPNLNKSFVLHGQASYHIKICMNCRDKITIPGPAPSPFSRLEES